MSPSQTYGDIWFGGMPSSNDLRVAADRGVRTVVNLRNASEHPDFDEEAAATSLGLAYHNPGFNGGEQFTDARIDGIRELLTTAPRPLLLHCASANRVGGAWIPYRVLDLGADLDTAIAEAKTIGLRSAAYEQRAREYIDSQRPTPTP